MSAQSELAAGVAAPAPMSVFERYLTVTSSNRPSLSALRSSRTGAHPLCRGAWAFSRASSARPRAIDPAALVALTSPPSLGAQGGRIAPQATALQEGEPASRFIGLFALL